MTGENPYAPPAVTETEAPSARYWHTYGTSLIVRNGTTLPRIDLETGAEDENLRPIQRVLEASSSRGVLRFLILLAVGSALVTVLKLDTFTAFFIAGACGLILRPLFRLRGITSRVSVWTFTEERRAKRALLHKRIRLGSVFLLVAVIFLRPAGRDWILAAYLGWLGLMAALGVWALLDKPKAKLRYDKSGWMRITPLHPEALKKFHELEARLFPPAAPGRKRRMSTIYYHRYPLRMLIGPRIYNPLAVLTCALMKLLRSRLMVRDFYHFSEAEETPLENLNPQLRDATTAWLAAHPGWTFINGEHLTSPAGDLTIENAILASPGLEHAALIHRAWMEQRPQKGITHFTFTTWLTDGTHAATLDQPFLSLKNPQLYQRVSGTPEQVWQAHLRHVSSLPVSPAADVAELRARILHDREESDRLLTEKGLQSETREV